MIRMLANGRNMKHRHVQQGDFAIIHNWKNTHSITILKILWLANTIAHTLIEWGAKF